MTYARPAAFLAIWALIAFLIRIWIPSLGELFEPRTVLFVLALPWLLVFAGASPSEVLLAARDPFDAHRADLPVDRRRRSAGILRSLGSLSVSAGVVAFFSTSIATFRLIASSGGQANSMEFMSAAPAALLAPLYGYVLLAFVYGPLAGALESDSSGLGLELAE